RYPAASSAKYAISNRPLPTSHGQTPASARQTATATGANTTSAVTSATATAASTSGARASSRFQSAWNHAAASAKTSADVGMGRRYALARMRAVVFDFNGTLSNDEPVLARVYQELFAELGRPLTETEYFEHLAGHTDEEMLLRWFGRSDDRWIAERIARYNALVADGSTVDEEMRAAVRYAAARVP